MFHSLFHVFIFDMTSHDLLMFGITLRRRKFPANVRVHIADNVVMFFLQFQHFCCTKTKMCLVIAQPSPQPHKDTIP